ncbi:MAG TPA: DUF929 family protein [Chloroflexota bacterium]|nr:DUF929 family protein [Chloroflexota bacterium]
MSTRQRPPGPSGTPRGTGRSGRANRRGRDSNRSWIVLGAAIAIILVIAALVIIRFANSSGSASTASPVSDAVLHDLSSVSAATENAVGSGSGPDALVAVRDQPLTGAGNRPQVVYYGAEYCPYCATERWAMIVALNRFGSFTGLKTTHSASDDVYPNTPTFTFYGSTYQSQYLDFTPIEQQTNVKVNGQYSQLQTPTPDQQQLFQRYNAPPYIPAEQAGGIPFVDIANQYVMSGTTVDPNLFQGKTWEQIASRLNDPSTDESKAIVGGANRLTAAICLSTNNAPAEVCSQPAIKQIAASLQAKAVPK